MEFFIRTAEGSAPVTTQQIAELREQGRLTDDMRCLSIGCGDVWMTYPEVFAKLQAMTAGAKVGTPGGQAGYPCPGCFADVPPESLVCPFCGSSLADCLPDAVLRDMLAERVGRLDEALASMEYPAQVRELRGGISPQFWVSLLLMLGFGGLTVKLAGMKGDEAGFAVATGIAAVISLLCWLVAWSKDFNGNHIATASKAKSAFTRFFSSLKVRPNKAYSVLAPSAWKTGRLPEVLFEIIPNRTAQPEEFHDPKGFKDYWKSFFRGKSGMTQTVRMSRVTEIKISDNIVLVQADVKVSSYSSALALLILLGLAGIVIAIIVIAIVTKRETVTFRKLLLRRDGRWFVLDGMYNSPLDTERAAELLGSMFNGPR